MKQKSTYGYIDVARLSDLVKARGPIMKQCREMGIITCTLYQLLNEKRRPTTRTLVLLADYYGVTVDYLLGREQC